METVVIMVGLPGSGKTSIAKNMAKLNPKTVHIESDAIRDELFNGKQGREETNKVFEEMFRRTVKAVKEGYNVVYDATNVSYKDRRRLVNSLPKDVKKLCYTVATPIDVCKERNSKRENPVPEDVIDRMARRFCYPLKSEGFDVRGTVISKGAFGSQVEPDFTDNVTLTDFVSFMKGRTIIPAWEALSDTGLAEKIYTNLSMLAPEFKSIIGLAQDNPNHTFSVSNHMFHTWKDILKQKEEYKDSPGYEDIDWDSLCITALVHDVGKGFTKSFTDSKGNPTKHAHFYNHDNVSAYVADMLCTNISYLSNVEIDIDTKKIVTLTQFHMKLYPYSKNEKQWKKLVKDDKTVTELHILNNADKSAK